MFHWFKSRIHEPIAIASIAGAAASLHAAWIVNLLFFRQARTDTLVSLYLFVACVYAIIFAFTFVWCRGRDCSDLRGRVLHAFYVAALIFLAMTFPLVYGFAI